MPLENQWVKVEDTKQPSFKFAAFYSDRYLTNITTQVCNKWLSEAGITGMSGCPSRLTDLNVTRLVGKNVILA